jgi:protein-tyrosine kinase
MTLKKTPSPGDRSLIERAAAAYDLPDLLQASQPRLTQKEDADRVIAWPIRAPAPALAPSIASTSIVKPPIAVDRDHLRDQGLIVPQAPPSALSEEFRLIKRQLLMAALGSRQAPAIDRGRLILICSAQPNEGKTFCAVNLALSMASETDVEVLLIDADVAKPEVLSTLGVAGDEGLMDALANPSIDVETLIIKTDIANLTVLPAGRQTHQDTELLASARTREVIDGLLAANERRIILFDSAPALAASPASVLATHVGQTVLVVRADQTDLKLMLNAVSFGAASRKFGSYYGFGS